MNFTREADVTDAAHFAAWPQIMKDAFPGPSASQRQIIYHSDRYTADLGSTQAWHLEAERVIRLIPGLETDGRISLPHFPGCKVRRWPTCDCAQLY
jgi:hypothetical protein